MFLQIIFNQTFIWICWNTMKNFSYSLNLWFRKGTIIKILLTECSNHILWLHSLLITIWSSVLSHQFQAWFLIILHCILIFIIYMFNTLIICSYKPISIFFINWVKSFIDIVKERFCDWYVRRRTFEITTKLMAKCAKWCLRASLSWCWWIYCAIWSFFH